MGEWANFKKEIYYAISLTTVHVKRPGHFTYPCAEYEPRIGVLLGGINCSMQ